MKQFAELFLALDRTNKTNEKVELLRQYFMTAPEEDKIWALALFTGRRPSFKVNSTQIQQWAAAEAGIPDWLFRESYHGVGDWVKRFPWCCDQIRNTPWIHPCTIGLCISIACHRWQMPKSGSTSSMHGNNCRNSKSSCSTS